ncbi:MAG: protein kinase domain-containing protein [bacterium]
MSPEQLRAEPQSPATDIYGLGVLLHEMLFGHPPFRASSVADFLLRAMREELTFPAAPSLPLPVRSFILRALSKDPKHRPASARAALAELEKLMAVNEEREHTLPASSRGLGHDDYEAAPAITSPAPSSSIPKSARQPAEIAPSEKRQRKAVSFTQCVAGLASG